MIKNLQLPVVRPSEVDGFNDEVEHASAGDGFVVAMNPIVPSEAEEVQINALENQLVKAIEDRLHALMRLALLASYTANQRIVKVANLGHFPGDDFDRASVPGVANVLNTLIRTGFGSLAGLEDWAETGPPDTERYLRTLDLIRQAQGMYRAMGAADSEKLQRLDLWFETSSSPFGHRSREILDARSRYFLGGHLLQLAEPAFDWSSEEPTLFTRTRSLSSFDASAELGSSFGSRLISWVNSDQPRTIIVKIRPEESSVVDSLITAAGEAVNLGWVLIADGSLTVEAIDRLVATLRVRSHHLMGVECRPFGELEPAVNSASVAIAHLCDLGLHK